MSELNDIDKPGEWGWRNITFTCDDGTQIIHTVPINDSKPHETNQCQCEPDVDEAFTTIHILHHSYDQRELYETGERTPN